MQGLTPMTENEKKELFGGYNFTCPKTKTELQKKVKQYQKESQAKPNAYIVHCYEECGIR